MENSAKMVWSPRFDSVPRSPVGLEVKLGSLVTLLLLTLVCGLVPLFILQCRRSVGLADTRRKVLSLVSCFAGGVFLATCLLDLLPDYLVSMSEAMERLHVTLQFPLPEFILAMGFFLVLVMEQIVLAFKDQSGSLDETQTLLGTSVNNQIQIQTRHWHDGPVPAAQQHGEERVHIHIDFNSHSTIRSFILVFSLSLHSVFEGLAVGLQETSSKVLEISLALLIHKSIIACSLALKLVQSQLRQTVVVTCILLFAVMTPLGIGLGIALTESSNDVHQLSRSVLEGIATGTFIYITFLEILPHELSSSQQRILKVLLLITGFSVVTGVLFIKI
uniref:Zinc transporter ZIP1 n=1 Tax=Geotrypetes seraphini TaxID=260995 RepID=A0A6P8P8D8_GEOSA|nr:zinc transporter ZIP1 [Geotrypetes seraphini]XP_033780003.1 zinc transporter ZIP1 [Geotrypetes seraphini]XP_033780004.1 zinc transporter ZIP1 [Geotrypetes seraphini]XP_033780005.1 zinc transporter ZIP1 [Geotrypetes seraphini]